MQVSKPTLASAALLLLLGCYIAYGVVSPGDAADSGESPAAGSAITRLFSSDKERLEQRVARLETSLQSANQIQAQLLELVEAMQQRLEGYPAEQPPEIRTAGITQAQVQQEQPRETLSRHQRYQKYRNMQLQRLIDAGLNPDRAEFILQKQERFQYEQMKLAYEYRYLQNKSSPEAQTVKEQLDIYSNPRKMLQHELSEQEFELYLEANGGRQEMRIDNVISGTPAFEAGLRPGDKIISYNGERVFHMGDLRSQVYKVAPGKTVPIEVQRAGSSGSDVIYVPSGPLGIQG